MPKINGNRVRQAREIRGWTQEDLARRLGVQQPHISYVEQGIEAPSDSLIHSVVLATGFPLSFFTGESGPDFPMGSLLFRKKRKLKSSETAQLRQSGREILRLVVSLSSQFKAIPNRLPVVSGGDAREAAEIVRSVLGMSPDGPVTGLVRRLEKAGVLVAYLPIEIPGLDGFSTWSDESERRPVICLAPNMPGDRVRYTLGEEVGHLTMHQDFLGSLSERDAEARVFSGELLYPSQDMTEELRLPITLSHLAELKAAKGVSMQAILQFAEQRGMITPRQKGYVRAKMAKRGWLTEEPVHIPVEKPRLWKQMAEEAFGTPLDYRLLARHLGTSASFVESLFEVNRPHVSSIKPSPRSDVLEFKRKGTIN